MSAVHVTPLGEHLRALRAERGLTQRAMAEGLGVTPSYLSALEHGRRGTPSWEFLQRLIGYLGVIWDDAEALQRLAILSDPRVTIDTAHASANATRLANLLAERIATLDQDKVQELLDILEN